MATDTSVRQLEITKDDGGYGFNLSKAGTIHFLRVVEDGGAAARAGARAGDRILKVNGQDVTSVSHSQLVTLIKVCGKVLKMEVRQLTPDEVAAMQSGQEAGNGAEKGAQQAKPAASQVQTAASGPAHSTTRDAVTARESRSASQAHPQSPTRRRAPEGLLSLMIVKGSKGFGFNLAKIEGRHVFRVVDPAGPADKAGAHPGDIIVQVNGVDVTQKEHKDVVGLIRDSGPSVQIDVVPNSSAAAGELPTDLTSWANVRARAEGIIRANQQRIASAKEHMDQEWERKRQAKEQQMQAMVEKQRREAWEQSKRDMDTRLQQAAESLSKAQQSVVDMKNKAASMATAQEMEEMKQLLSGIEEKTRKELEEQHSGPLPEDEFKAELASMQRELEVMSLEEEICHVHQVEWKKLFYEARDRREKEEQEASKRHEETKDLRERDLDFLNKKKERLDRMLREAEEQRQAQVEAERKKREEEQARRQAEANARIQRLQEQAKRREQEERESAAREEAQRRREEEERQLREFQEKEEAKRRESQQANASAFSLVKPKLRSVGAGQDQLQKGPSKLPANHPMVAAMAKQRETMKNLPFNFGSDTKM